MVLENPVYVSHMSFGALSKEAKITLAKGTSMAKSAMCSGEGGIIPEEMEAADKYIFEYVANSLQRDSGEPPQCGCDRDQDRTGHQAWHGRLPSGR